MMDSNVWDSEASAQAYWTHLYGQPKFTGSGSCHELNLGLGKFFPWNCVCLSFFGVLVTDNCWNSGKNAI